MAYFKGLGKSYDRAVAKIFCRVDYVFSELTNDTGGIHTNSIGMERNSRDSIAKFWTYNIKRDIFQFGKMSDP